MNKKTITITIGEYEDLLEAQKKLDCLEGAGVDNWEGYDDAMSLMEEEEDQDYAKGED